AAGARRHRADVKVVSGGEAETDQPAFEENRHAETNVGTMRGAVIRRVVDDHIALLEAVAALFEEPEDALHVAGDRAQLERRRKRAFADLTALHVQQRDAEVLGLADDRRVRHPRQLVADLEHDAVQRACNDARGDGIDRLLGSLAGSELDDVYDRRSGYRHSSSPYTRIRRSPVSSTSRLAPGGTTVVE